MIFMLQTNILFSRRGLFRQKTCWCKSVMVCLQGRKQDSLRKLWISQLLAWRRWNLGGWKPWKEDLVGNELQGYVRKPESLDSLTVVSNTRKSTKSVNSAEDIYDILQDYYNHPKNTRIATFFENSDGNELRRSEERSIAGVHTASRTITEGTRKIGLSPDNREHIVKEGERNTDTRDAAYQPKPTDRNIGGGQFTVE